MIGTLAVDGWVVTFGTARMGLAGCGPAQSPPRCTKCSPITKQPRASTVDGEASQRNASADGYSQICELEKWIKRITDDRISASFELVLQQHSAENILCAEAYAGGVFGVSEHPPQLRSRIFLSRWCAKLVIVTLIIYFVPYVCITCQQ